MTRLSLGAIAAALSSLPALAWADANGDHHGYMWFDGWGGMMIFGPLMMIAVVAAIVVLVVLALRWLGGTGHAGAPPGKTALDVLEERFARGEIDKEEFEERRRVLDG